MDNLWERVRAGQHTAVLGPLSIEPPPLTALRIVRVRCDVPSVALGPLLEARRKIEPLLGTTSPRFNQARDRMVQGLRRRLLGDVPALETEGALVEAYNHLAQVSDRPAVLVFEAVDAADEASLLMLRRILMRTGWLKLPVVLVFRVTDPVGPAATLLNTLRSVAGAGSVLRVELPQAPRLELRTLPHDVLRVLRAGALVGSGFEAELVAALLDLTVLEVLERLQRAADAGVPVEDLGEQRFHLPEPLLDAARASMLPSLMIAWHQRLAELLQGFGASLEHPSQPLAEPENPRAMHVPHPFPIPVFEPEVMDAFSLTKRPSPRTMPSAPMLPPEEPAVPRTPPPQTPLQARAELEEPLKVMVESSIEEDSPPTERGVLHDPGPELESTGGLTGKWSYAEIFGDKGSSVADPAAGSLRPRAAIATHEAATRSPSRESVELSRPPSGAWWKNRSDARAAGHLMAAGELDDAAERYLAAARQSADAGFHAQAFACAERAAAILEQLPAAPARRRLRARALMEIGRLKWQAAGPTTIDDSAIAPSFTLAGAIETLEAARKVLTDEEPPALKAELATLIAGVCYDVGDLPTLARALDELTMASRILLASGDATGAARLLNDQAAVYVRMGDPVQATRLLSESRKVFEERATLDPVAELEMAETDHLFARIPLHVKARLGRESDALTMGLDHALAAEQTYRKLDARRELGRVWETMGRLELKKGRFDRALERLKAAVQIEESTGDLVGLARSTAALSELFAANHRVEDALGVLSDSVTLNFEKGSPLGLAFNRRALSALQRTATAPPAGLAEIEAKLATAETVLGRMKLPGEQD